MFIGFWERIVFGWPRIVEFVVFYWSSLFDWMEIPNVIWQRRVHLAKTRAFCHGWRCMRLITPLTLVMRQKDTQWVDRKVIVPAAVGIPGNRATLTTHRIRHSRLTLFYALIKIGVSFKLADGPAWWLCTRDRIWLCMGASERVILGRENAEENVGSRRENAEENVGSRRENAGGHVGSRRENAGENVASGRDSHSASKTQNVLCRGKNCGKKEGWNDGWQLTFYTTANPYMYTQTHPMHKQCRKVKSLCSGLDQMVGGGVEMSGAHSRGDRHNSTSLDPMSCVRRGGGRKLDISNATLCLSRDWSCVPIYDHTNLYATCRGAVDRVVLVVAPGGIQCDSPILKASRPACIAGSTGSGEIRFLESMVADFRLSHPRESPKNN